MYVQDYVLKVEKRITLIIASIATNTDQQGYVQCGLVDGLASTYFISEFGRAYCKA